MATRKPACTRVLWRGVVVCSHSVPKLNAWAASTGQAVLIWPLAGCGSYQTSTKASAGTHAGGGAIDVNANPHSSLQRVMVVRKAREVGLQVGWYRAYRAGVWTHHYHVLDPDCPQLASVAASQCVDCFNNDNGLVGTAPDDGWRGNIGQLRTVFANRFYLAVADIVSGIEDIAGTITKPPAPSSGSVSIANIPVGLTSTIRMSNLKVGRRGGDVARYQAALWNRLPGAVRQEFITKYGLKRTDLYDGIYGKVTAAMTARLYQLIKLPPYAPEPGAKMMRHLGFTSVR